MIDCPSCHRSVEITEQNHGTLFTCPHCNSVYFIGWDGLPEIVQHDNSFGQEFQSQGTEQPFAQASEEDVPSVSEVEPSFVENPAVVESDEGSLDVPYDFGQTLDQTTHSVTPVSDSPNFSEVTDFANSDTGLTPLVYTVIIDGLESSLLLGQLKEAMTDSRFGWDVPELMNQVSGGRLILKGLNPAKASVLVNRIKYLPLKISWRQDVLPGS